MTPEETFAVQQLQAQFNEVVNERNTLQTQVSSLTQQLADATMRHNMASNEVSELTTKFTVLNGQVTTLTSELEDAHRTIQELRNDHPIGHHDWDHR